MELIEVSYRYCLLVSLSQNCSCVDIGKGIFCDRWLSTLLAKLTFFAYDWYYRNTDLMLQLHILPV